jgi:hypothetical protein
LSRKTALYYYSISQGGWEGRGIGFLVILSFLWGMEFWLLDLYFGAERKLRRKRIGVCAMTRRPRGDAQADTASYGYGQKFS